MERKKKKYWLRGGFGFGFIGFVVPLATFIIAQTCTRLGSFTLNGSFHGIIESETCSYVGAIITPWNLIIALVLAVCGFIGGSILGSILGKFIKPKKQLISDEFQPQSVLAEKVRASLVQPNYMPAPQKKPEEVEKHEGEAETSELEEDVTPVASPIPETPSPITTPAPAETPVAETLEEKQ